MQSCVRATPRCIFQFTPRLPPSARGPLALATARGHSWGSSVVQPLLYSENIQKNGDHHEQSDRILACRGMKGGRPQLLLMKHQALYADGTHTHTCVYVLYIYIYVEIHRYIYIDIHAHKRDTLDARGSKQLPGLGRFELHCPPRPFDAGRVGDDVIWVHLKLGPHRTDARFFHFNQPIHQSFLPDPKN